MNASIVVGLQFGDEGKGRCTDMVTNEGGIVVRFNGGQQAGHTIIRNGHKHVCSNYGSGVLKGCPTYFSEHTTFYLNTIAKEREQLKSLGYNPELIIHPLAKVTTPYDVAWNRLTERLNNHGSCGLGIAATMERTLNSGYQLYAIDFTYKEILRKKLQNIKEYYIEKAAKHDRITEKEYMDEYLLYQSIYMHNINEELFTVADYDVLNKYFDIVFEGAQGIMLDMTHGIFPNVTYSNTTSKNAWDIIRNLNIRDVETYYVTRCYQTRHGAGWMSNEDNVELIHNGEEINVYNEWQKDFRIGELDYNLLNYALDIDRIYSERGKKNLVITCLDQRPNFRFDVTQLNHMFHEHYEVSSADGEVKPFVVPYFVALNADYYHKQRQKQLVEG